MTVRVVARDPQRRLVLLDGVGSLGVGQMWQKEVDRHTTMPGYDTAESIYTRDYPLFGMVGFSCDPPDETPPPADTVRGGPVKGDASIPELEALQARVEALEKRLGEQGAITMWDGTVRVPRKPPAQSIYGYGVCDCDLYAVLHVRTATCFEEAA